MTIGANQTTATVAINATADLVVEPDETVVLTVTSGTGYTPSGSPATGTITNDEADGSISGYKFEDIGGDGIDATSTIGYTDVFDSTVTSGNRRAQQVTMAEDGTITSISIYHEGGSGHVLLAVYDDSGVGGLPGSRLGVTASTLINASAGWQTEDLLSPVVVSAGQTVWLAWIFESNPGIRYEVGTPGRADSGQVWTGDLLVDMPLTFGSSTQGNFVYSIYATYSEPRLADWTINLYLDDGDGVFDETTPTATQVTGPDGTYSFPDLVGGGYWVREVPQAGWSQTTVDPSLITIASGDHFTEIDYPALAFGDSELVTGEIHGFKWHDLDGNGLWGDEPGLEGWTIYVDLNGNGVLDAGDISTVTDADGSYSFPDLTAGTYTVAEELRDDWSQTYPVAGGTHTVVVSAGVVVTNINFGNQGPVVGLPEVYGSVVTAPSRRAMPFVMPESGSLESISIYHDGGSGNILLGVYDDSSSPGSRLGVTALTAVNSTAGWETIDLAGAVDVVAGQTIWLAWVFESNPGIRYTTGSPGRAHSSQTWSGGMPETFGSSTQADYIYSIYAT